MNASTPMVVKVFGKYGGVIGQG